MSKRNHPIEQEELMAYLDGELATNRAVEAAAHLEHCAECQEFAAELRKISAEMMAWEVEQPASAEMPDGIAAALEKKKFEPKRKKTRGFYWRGLFTARRLAWGSGITVCFLLILAASIPNLLRSRATQMLQGDAVTLVPLPTPSPDSGTTFYYNGNNGLGKLAKISPGVSDGFVTPRQGATKSAGSADDTEDADDLKTSLPAMPMIARTVGVTLVTKEFEKTRSSLDEILKRHNGYFGEMNANAPDGGARTFTATLRIPASQLDAALAELKQLGRVEKEAQGGEEVTQQYVDLQARLANAQHTEQRLTQILQQRTGKLQDVLKVELEIDRVRGEIEQMQAEKKELTKRVAFATLNMTVQEEYQARLQGAPPSTGSKFRNAAVDGYNTVIETFISIGLFLLSAGPSLLVWFAILFFPARFAWKKWKKEFSPRRHGDTEEK